MMRSRTLRRIAVLVGVVLLAPGCGSANDDSAATTFDPTTTITATTAPTTTAAAPETTITPSLDGAFTETEGFTYFTVGEEAFEADIYVPEGEGPWPVVVMFHGNSADGKDDLYTIVVAETAAAAEMYVFVPNWLTGITEITPESFDAFHAVANCAVANAQPNPEDSVPIVVYGFSAGTGPASRAALDPAGDPVPGCAVENAPGPITGAVLGDGEYFLHSFVFDRAFAADPDSMQATVAGGVDPSFWPTDMETRFFLWVADEGTLARTFDHPWDETGWLAQRDPDGSIRDDLDRLGQLDDGVISFIDQGEFMALRLEEAGTEVTLDYFPGGHQTFDKVPELVDYLKDAATVDEP